MNDTPQVLLQHHLKKLRLPTFLGEYSKLAQQCAAESEPWHANGPSDIGERITSSICCGSANLN